MKTPFRFPPSRRLCGLLLALACVGVPVRAVRAQATGDLDPGFLAHTNDVVRVIALQPDGKILIGGDFTTVNDTPRQHLARLNVDGTLDAAFDPGADGPVYALAVQPADNLIVVGGSFSTVANASAGGNIGRLYPDGTPDMVFVANGAYTDGPVHALAVLRDGKIALGGDFYILNGQGHANIGYLHGDGTIAADVVPPSPNGPVYAIALNLLGDGVIFGGAFTFLEDDTTLIYNNIAALDNDGALDPAFMPGTGANNTVYAIQSYENFIYLLGGLFTSYNGVMDGGLAGIESDGTLPTGAGSFYPNGPVYAIAVAPSNPLALAFGGAFTNIIGESGPYYHVTQVSDGVSPDFAAGTGTDGPVYAMTYQADGKLLIGGAFTTYNGAPQVGIARVYGRDSVNVSVNLPAISRGAHQKAKVIFALDGDRYIDHDITVGYKLKGALVNGKDYKELSGFITIPEGFTKATLKIKSTAGGANGKLKLTLLPSTEDYITGASPTVKVKITN